MKKTAKTMKTMVGWAIVALAGAALVACGGGAPRAPAAVDADEALVAIPLVGVWEWEDDAGDGGSSTIDMTEVQMGGATAWRFHGEIGDGTQYGYAGMELVLDEVMMANLMVMSSISFMAQGEGRRHTVRLHDTNVTDWAWHGFPFDTTANEPQLVTIPVRMFMQPSWGRPVRFDQNRVSGLSWQVELPLGPFDLTIWDITLHVPESLVVTAVASVEIAEEEEYDE
jgi:hypothetical protein